ncbi:MAG: mannose-6-phosphate isomerase, class I, partial [Elusimicrobia bacterium]|nr:mannose-6-phosphate isomerase, class I [Elusimicrobiota bacterium]
AGALTLRKALKIAAKQFVDLHGVMSVQSRKLRTRGTIGILRQIFTAMEQAGDDALFTVKLDFGGEVFQRIAVSLHWQFNLNHPEAPLTIARSQYTEEPDSNLYELKEFISTYRDNLLKSLKTLSANQKIEVLEKFKRAIKVLNWIKRTKKATFAALDISDKTGDEMLKILNLTLPDFETSFTFDQLYQQFGYEDFKELIMQRGWDLIELQNPLHMPLKSISLDEIFGGYNQKSQGALKTLLENKIIECIVKNALTIGKPRFNYEILRKTFRISEVTFKNILNILDIKLSNLQAHAKAILQYNAHPIPLKIRCGVQNYVWGDKKFIPELLGIDNPEKKPNAELWIGANPTLPAKADISGMEFGINELIKWSAEKVLGREALRQFGRTLPYLLKVLSAAKTLSIQGHPYKEWAARRFKEGNKNYKDSNHKPEIIRALTEFWALNGFREYSDIVTQIKKTGLGSKIPGYDKFKTVVENIGSTDHQKNEALRNFYSTFMNTSDDELAPIVKDLIAYAKNTTKIRKTTEPKDEAYWINHIAQIIKENPDDYNENDSGILSVLLFNLEKLEPGDAMFIDAGEPHAYLEGSGMELMANSDNVLRGGLTKKTKDIKELLKILTFKAGGIIKCEKQKVSETETVYITPSAEFEMSNINIAKGQIHKTKKMSGADSLIVLEGSVKVISNDGTELELNKGETAFIPFACGGYRIKSISDNAQLCKASIPENPANEKAKRDCEQNFAPEHEAPELIGIAEGVWQIVKNGEMLLEKAL